MNQPREPEYVSFADASHLIVRRGLAGSMTPRGLRYIADARSNNRLPEERRWPFGNGPGQEPYLKAGRTRMMRTVVLVEYLEKFPPTGRGPARKAPSDSPEQ